jgi:hypothetical protein
MVNNVDVAIYVSNLITDLNEEQFFDENVNPLMDLNIFRDKLTEIATKNLKEHGDLTLDVIQFETLIIETRKAVIQDTVSSLYKKELLDVVGINEGGEMLYAPSQKAKTLLGDINKKNI